MKIAVPSEIDLVLYHGDCFDGFTAAWCAWLRYNCTADYVPVFYGDLPVDVTGRNVALVDFAYKRPVLQSLAENAKSIVVLDHHKTAQEDLDGLPYAIFDMDRSGARIAYDWFLGAQSWPNMAAIENLVNYVQDRDLWRFALPVSRTISSALKAVPYEFTRWSEFAERLLHEPTSVILEGIAIAELTERHLDLLEKTAELAFLDGHPCYVANAPYVYASELANRLALRDGLGLGVAWRYDHRRELTGYSLRSAPNSGIDVSEIAREHGGGGHVHSAGFEDRGDLWDVITKDSEGAFFPCVTCGEAIPLHHTMVFGDGGIHKHMACEGAPKRS